MDEGAAGAQVKVRETEEIVLDSKMTPDFHFKVEVTNRPNSETQINMVEMKTLADILTEKDELMKIITNRTVTAMSGIQLATLMVVEEKLDLDLEEVVTALKVSPNRRKIKNKKNIDMEDQTHTHSHHLHHLMV
jgi:hypothetical protein